MFIENARVLKKDKDFILEKKKFKSFHSGTTKYFGSNQNALFLNEMELGSPLPMASMWPVRSSERRDQAGDKSRENTG